LLKKLTVTTTAGLTPPKGDARDKATYSPSPGATVINCCKEVLGSPLNNWALWKPDFEMELTVAFTEFQLANPASKLPLTIRLPN
jgi:hypothetical protein